MTKKLSAILFLIVMSMTVSVFGQSPQKATAYPGEVVATSPNGVFIKTSVGDVMVMYTERTAFKTVPPANPTAPVDAKQGDIGVGDKVLVVGILSDDKKMLPATKVFIMSKAAIAERNTKESEEWIRRGVSGRVSAVNAEAKQITVDVRGIAGTTAVVVSTEEKVPFRRYAPNSIKYSESVASTLAEIQPGDMLRARGEKSADGKSFTAEEVITGAFQTIAGTVKSVDAAGKKVVVTNLQTKKDVTVDLGSAIVLKKFPEEFAQRMAAAQSGGAPGAAGAGRPAGAGGAPAGGSSPGGPPTGGQAGGGRGFGGRGGSGGIDDMLDRFPTITAADLKPGDMIAVSSTKTDDPDHITAIKFLAGVEPFIRASQAAATGGGRGGRGSQNAGFTNIPGLDGFDAP